MDNQTQHKDLTLRDYYHIFMKNKWLIGGFTFAVSVIAIVISLLLPLWYAGTATIIRPSSQVLDMSTLKMDAIGIFGSSDAVTNRYLSILNSRQLKEKICKRYDLVDIYEVKDMDKAVLKFEDKFKVEIGDENQINITIYDQDQERVAEMVNWAVFLLDSINISLSTEYGRKEKDFIEMQLQSVMDSLHIVEVQLMEYMDKKNALNVEEQFSSEMQYAADLKYQIMLKAMDVEFMEKTHQSLPLLNVRKMELDGLQKQYDQLFGDDDELFMNLGNVPEIAVQLGKMQRQVEYFNQVLLFLGPLYEQAKISEAKNIPAFEVLDQAHRPDRKAKPKRSIIVIASFLFALLTSGVYTLLKETKE